MLKCSCSFLIDISTLFFCTLPLRKLKPQILFRKGTIRRFGNWLADRQTGFTKVHKENGLPTPLPDDVRHENSNIAKIVKTTYFNFRAQTSTYTLELIFKKKH